MLMLDQIHSTGSITTDQFILAIDFRDVGYSNMHKDTVKAVVRTAQNVYLGTMYKIVFFNASLTARMLFGMVRPFLSQRAQSKIQFISS